MNKNNGVEFITDHFTDIELTKYEAIVQLIPDDKGVIGNLYVLGPANPEYDDGRVLLSAYKLSVNDDGKLVLLED
jgi:hypothetical protein